MTQLHNKFINTCIVIPKPEITPKPINASVKRVGSPITLTCTVSGDPNHYWVGWLFKDSIIQRGDAFSLYIT